MAEDMNDPDFAQQCRTIAEAGKKNITEQLFNRDYGYFIHELDSMHPRTPNANIGCHIDQVYGQSWAWQTALPRVLPKAETVSALQSIFDHNFYRRADEYLANAPIKRHRVFSLDDEPATFMCTFPNSGGSNASFEGGVIGGYFSENMSGFTYQVASHMIAEGLVTEGLALCRAIHDRYDPQRRNPYNAIEYGNHYSRDLSSYGVFISLCGFEHLKWSQMCIEI